MTYDGVEHSFSREVAFCTCNLERGTPFLVDACSSYCLVECSSHVEETCGTCALEECNSSQEDSCGSCSLVEYIGLLVETCETCNLEEDIPSQEVPCAPCAHGDNVLHELHVLVEDTVCQVETYETHGLGEYTASQGVTCAPCGQGGCTPSLVESCGTCDDLDEWQEGVEDSPLMEVSIP